MHSLTRSQLLRRGILAGLGCAMAFTINACTANPTGQTNYSSTENVASSKVLTIAIDPAFPPFQAETPDGEREGFELDLLNAVAEATGFEVELEVVPFTDIIPALQAGTIDATISSMTITAERSQLVDFSRPYFQSGLAIAVPALEEEIESFEDLQGVRIGVQPGTTGEMKANEANAQGIVAFDNSLLALQALANNEVDAVINDAPVNQFVIKTGTVQGIRNIEEPLTVEYYGMAVRQGDTETLDLLNQGLTTVIENGTYEEIYRTWFTGDPPGLPESAPL